MSEKVQVPYLMVDSHHENVKVVCSYLKLKRNKEKVTEDS